MIQLPEGVKVIKKEGARAVFEISPLAPGYGPTIANPLRRVLLSSMEGAAITSIKIKGIDHEFSTIPGIQEDIIQLILNIKKVRVRSFSSEPVILTLEAKGQTEVTAGNIKTTPDVEVITEDQHICTMTDKKAELSMELTVEKGIGYVPVEQRQKDKLPIGVLAIDAIFTPVKLVNFHIEDVRVGDRIDYNKVTMEIETDGSLSPEQALKNAADLLVNHFQIVSQVEVVEPEKPVKKSRKSKDK